MEDKNAHRSSELHELERLAVLEAAALLDTPEEETFDRFTRLASRILKAPVALVSLVDQERQFFKSCVGLPDPWATSRETPLSHSFCKHVVSCEEVLAVPDARTHPLLHNNRAIVDLGVVAYLGIPLTTDEGYTLGSFCAIDSQPREWTPQDIAILQDISNLVIEKIELRLLAKRLHADYLQLRNLELYREEMVQMLVHDLRNPLTSLLGGLSLVQGTGALTEQDHQYVSVAQKGGDRLLRMINNILDVSQAEAGQLELTLVETSPTHILEMACEQMAPLADKAGVRLEYDAARVMLQRADVEKLCRVVINLVGNAIQNTPAGGIISVQAQADEGPSIRFSVTDTGCGIPSDAFECIFQKFGRIKNNQVAGKSTGLGLPFSRMMVEAHGGRIWVESELGQGTSFHFTIPVHPSIPAVVSG